MYISDGSSTKKFTLYPPTRTITETYDNQWIDGEEDIQPLFTISNISEDSKILNTLEIINHHQNMDMINSKKDLILNICHLGICLSTPWKNLVAL